MPVHHPIAPSRRRRRTRPPTCSHGGPVLSKVKVYTVFWNNQVQFQSQLNAFYTAMTNSAYFDWLTECNTPTQTIGRGSFIGFARRSVAAGGHVITNSTFRPSSSRSTAARFPAPTADTLYMVHFPPGPLHDLDGSGSWSCSARYHNTYVVRRHKRLLRRHARSGRRLRRRLRRQPSMFNNLTSVSSHELIEATTDAAVGLATTSARRWRGTTPRRARSATSATRSRTRSPATSCRSSGRTRTAPASSPAVPPARRSHGQAVADAGRLLGLVRNLPVGPDLSARGQCQQGCVPQCTGKQCGSDGCGGSCRLCPSGQTCWPTAPARARSLAPHDDCATQRSVGQRLRRLRHVDLCADDPVLLHDGLGLDLRR